MRSNNAPVVSVNDSEPPAGWRQRRRFPGGVDGDSRVPGSRRSRSTRASWWAGRSSHRTSRSTSPTRADKGGGADDAQSMRRAAIGVTFSMLAACARCAELHGRRGRGAAAATIVITPSSGCGLLTAYTAGTGLPAWSSPAPSCGAGALTLAFNQGNTPPPAALSQLAASGRRAALCVGLVAQRRARGSEDGLPDHAPRRESRSTTCRLRRSASCRTSPTARGWIGLTYWNGGTAQVHPNGTAVDAAASWSAGHHLLGDRAALCRSRCARGQGRSELSSSLCTRPRRRARASPPIADPASLWDQAGAGGGSGTRQATPGRFPVPGRIRRAFVA